MEPLHRHGYGLSRDLPLEPAQGGGNMIELEYICGTCGTRIADGDGVIRVQFGALSDYRQALTAFQEERGPSRPASIADFLARPRLVPWQILHLVCRPQGEDGYEIDIEQVRTWRKLLEWTAHLMEKNWLGSTNWATLIGSAARGDHDGIKSVHAHGDAA